MNATDIEFLDDVAKCAMTAMIAKSPFTTNQDVSVETLKQLQNSVAKGAYSYALNMLKTRNEIITIDNINKGKVYSDYLNTVVKKTQENIQTKFAKDFDKFIADAVAERSSIGTISPGGFLSEDDKPVPEAAAYYGTEESKTVSVVKQESKLICFLYGRPVRSDTELITIDRTTENFEEHGRDLKNTHDNNEKARILEYLKHDARGWNNYLMEKPVLWLRNKPVYRDSVLLSRVSMNDPFTEEIGASDYDEPAGGIPIELLQNGGDGWENYYKVK